MSGSIVVDAALPVPWSVAGVRSGHAGAAAGGDTGLVPQLQYRSRPARPCRARLVLFGVALALVAVACAVPSAGKPSGSGSAAPVPIPGAPERPTGPTEDAALVAIVDGDTIRVRLDGVEESVRYIGIDTPEPNPTSAATPEPFADEATAANRRLVDVGGRLVLERDVSERDRYGRLLRHVWVDDGGRWTLVNLVLVAEGFAQVTTYPPDVRYVDVLLVAQRAAREAGRGLWGVP